MKHATNTNYDYLLGQAVKGFRQSKIVGVSDDAQITFEYELIPGVKKTETKDLAQIQVLTIAN